MNEGQAVFYRFIMSITKEEKKNEAEALLKKCYEAQEEGIFDRKYIFAIMPELRSYIVESELPRLDYASRHFIREN